MEADEAAVAAAAPSRQKLQRVTQACDFCHRRGLKCVQPQLQPGARDGQDAAGPRPTDTVPSCLTCVKYGQLCTRNRKPKKRGTKPRPKTSDGPSECPACQSEAQAGAAAHTAESQTSGSLAMARGESRDYESDMSPQPSPDELFPAPELVTTLMNIYLDSIYPLYPFFCETELVLWWRTKQPAPNAAFYSSVLCMCALAALQAERGALFSAELGFTPNRALTASLLRASVRHTPGVFSVGDKVSLLRAYGLLAFVGTQLGDMELLHRYLGLYQGLAAQVGLYNEERWPAGLSACEKESRRRIFWTVYRLEVHNASVLGHPVRIPESQTFVHYPTGVHHPMIFPERNGKFENWMAGWNFTTQLYRVLEHAIVDFRSKRTARTTVLWAESRPKPATILQQLHEMQAKTIPPGFGQAAMKSADSGSNRCGFQVANILSTIHLVKMVVMASDDTAFNDVCQTVIDLVDSLGTVPKDYKRAFGAPLVQELLGVGFMLTSISGRLQTLSNFEHVQLKQIILFLVGFIDGLGDCIESAPNAAACLRASLSRVDQECARRIESESGREAQGH